MANETNSTMGQLLTELDVVVEKILRRIKQEYQPKDKKYLKELFKAHVQQKYVFMFKLNSA